MCGCRVKKSQKKIKEYRKIYSCYWKVPSGYQGEWGRAVMGKIFPVIGVGKCFPFFLSENQITLFLLSYFFNLNK